MGKLSEKLRKVASTMKKSETESYMSQSYLKNMQLMVSDLLEIVEPQADLEDWVDAKITKAHEALSDVHNYLRNNDQSEEE
jgi:hypothetical protein